MPKYSFNILWSEEDAEYMATCSSFPGLSAFGETEEEALSEAKIALQLFVESYEERGLRIPEPEIVKGYSGQIRLRLPKSVHARAARMAADDGVSLNQYITNAVNREVSGEEVEKRFLNEIKNASSGLRIEVLKRVYSGSVEAPFVKLDSEASSTPSDYVHQI